MNNNQERSEDEVVEWHTWSGRRHRFGAEEPAVNRWSHPYRRAACNRAICAEAWFQDKQPEIRSCKRCFPPVAASSGGGS
jgi:hypothetical protein